MSLPCSHTPYRLLCAGLLGLGYVILTAGAAMMAPMMFDSPGSQTAPLTLALFYSTIAAPLSGLAALMLACIPRELWRHFGIQVRKAFSSPLETLVYTGVPACLGECFVVESRSEQ